MRTSMTFGIMPSFQIFSAHFMHVAGKSPPRSAMSRGMYDFGADERVGSIDMTCTELWAELRKAHREWAEDGNDKAGQWCSLVFGTLGIEWV